MLFNFYGLYTSKHAMVVDLIACLVKGFYYWDRCDNVNKYEYIDVIKQINGEYQHNL